MRAERRRQIFLAWLLFIAMLPFFVVKITHRHDPGEAVCCSSDTDKTEHHSQNPDHCLICNFFLSPFLETHSFDLHFLLALNPIERVTFADEKVFSLSYSHYLRAPPAGC
ncbi:hypothetical protein H8S77_26010 [Parabacteroides sp. BX2]|uniref:DUF2946 domain-containing protein n=1 Tax=Parabacteroides segnis TaxID=2763058 RepID=A0ABR7E976_9BACT|nr:MULTISPECIES: hypothetical protein [Parabacteroides]MBC5646327.1 hypothetical protein [Parabacteroides segnis]MCM0716309.1 hypothetical protein [Parabacteroides sp. TA-V-105]